MIRRTIPRQHRPARQGHRVKTRFGFVRAEVELPDRLLVLPQGDRVRCGLPRPARGGCRRPGASGQQQHGEKQFHKLYMQDDWLTEAGRQLRCSGQVNTSYILRNVFTFRKKGSCRVHESVQRMRHFFISARIFMARSLCHISFSDGPFPRTLPSTGKEGHN